MIVTPIHLVLGPIYLKPFGYHSLIAQRWAQDIYDYKLIGSKIGVKRELLFTLTETKGTCFNEKIAWFYNA